MKTISYLILIALLLVSCPVLAADAAGMGDVPHDSILVNRTLPVTAAVGEKVTIAILLTNTGSGRKNVDLTEYLIGNAEFDESTAVTTTTTYNKETWMCSGPNCSTDKPSPLGGYTRTTISYHWTFSLAPGERKEVSYWIIPRSAGDFWIPSADLNVGGKVYPLPARSFPVSCKAGHACDPTLGENVITCPENCASSATDNICTPMKDNVCDKNCAKGYDPDCGASSSSRSKPLLAGIAILPMIAVGVGWILMRKRKLQEK